MINKSKIKKYPETPLTNIRRMKQFALLSLCYYFLK